MFIVEPIPVINKRLREHFGLREERPYFRLTWPNDEFEVRKVNYTPEGWSLLHPEFRKVHKYEKWRWDCWILERFTQVPVVNMKDLPDQAMSYEPIWTFDKGQLPVWPAVKLLIETCLNQARQGTDFKKYKHPLEGLTTKQQMEHRKAEIDAIYRELWGDETTVGDALAHERAVGFTTSRLMGGDISGKLILTDGDKK